MSTLSKEEIIEKLHSIMEPYVPDKGAFGSIDDGTNLLEDLQINSMNLVDIILDAEEAFGIEIDDEAAERMQTVGTAIAVIEEQLAKKEN